MKIFDKAQWHIDAGEDENQVINRMKVVFKFLDEKGMLTDDGKEIFEIGIDSSASLNEEMVTKKGYAFLDNYYDKVIGLKFEQITLELERLYDKFKYIWF